MNIQIFGTKKSFDTKKAQRYFKERRIKFQFIDLKEKGMSKGELESVLRAVGGIDAVLDPKAKDQDTLALITYLAESQKFDKLLENQQVLREPIVRNGRQATVGYAPDVWKGWE
ncbi:arsenate reductase family protein [Enorma burkinafasonensis]|uniref:arsenate reductase family protein n=1 Tax=Enorma burkinafasonensis TaxID=2590867 RepID=UPI0026EFD16E|nr:ArsC/Spx/MgsR family protein [Enorma burkinafasonensis]MCI7730694.1 ArsC family transcriptional regulator [Enorma burkinafasonensis]